MNGFQIFKEALFAAARDALRRAHEHDQKDNRHSTVGKFLLGLTDELVDTAVAPSDEFVVELTVRFAEILQCAQVLDDVVVYLKRFPPEISRRRYLAYHVRSYLQEMYILQQRLIALLNKYESWNKPLTSNSNASIVLAHLRDLIKKAFGTIVSTRDADVHERQFADPELERLEGWEGLANGSVEPTNKWMQDRYQRQVQTAREKWVKEIIENNAITWRVLDSADSTWKCNRTLFEKYFVRGSITKRLTRPVV